MSWLSDIFLKNRDLEPSFYNGEIFGLPVEQRAYLKDLALEICINFIARSIGQTEFRIIQDGKRIYDDWDYLLNVRPNTDSSAADFWEEVTYKLIFDSEVLVVLSDTNDLLIADSFTREEYAVYPDKFKNVTVKDYTFARTFDMDEVIYLRYNNKKLQHFMDGMFKDFTELFSRMIQTAMFSNQVRALASVEGATNLDKENTDKLQTFMDKLFNAFKTKAFAIVPKLKGFDYTEIANGSNNGRSVEDIMKVLDKTIEYVAEILGIPPALIFGSLSEYETAVKSYVKFTLDSLLKKIKDELNAKLLEKSEYQKGKRVKAFGIQEKSIFDIANSIDKLIASGAFSRNDVREEVGKERIDDPELDKYVLTKNYETIESNKKSDEGGEKENENES